MTEQLSAEQAAEAIRKEVKHDLSSHIPPEVQHRARFVEEVCGHLDLEPTTVNCAHVDDLLKKHNIEPADFFEWPKHFYNKDGRDMQVESPEALAELEAEDPGWSDKPPSKEKKKTA